MNLQTFRQSLTGIQPPANNSLYLSALWYDAKGDWNKAHALVDQLNDVNACRVHAYLHRKEGDDWNADYWYNRAGKKRPAASLEEEWEMLVSAFL